MSLDLDFKKHIKSTTSKQFSLASSSSVSGAYDSLILKGENPKIKVFDFSTPSISGNEIIDHINMSILYAKNNLPKIQALQNESNDKITINKGISLQEWKESLDYSDEQIKNIMEKILDDFDIKVNDNSLTWLNNVIDSTIGMYEKQYKTELNETTKKMLRNLITKMSYDRLCVKELI